MKTTAQQADAWIHHVTNTHHKQVLTSDQREALEAAFMESSASPHDIYLKRAMGHVVGAGQEHFDTSGMSEFDIPKDAAQLNGYVTIDPSLGQDEHIVPYDDDAQVMGEILTDTTKHNEQDISTGQIKFAGYQLSSKMIGVNESLLLTHPTYSSYILSRLGRRILKAEEYYCLQGSGVNQPTGLNTSAADSGISIAAASVTYDNLVDIEESVNQDYRYKSIWVMSPATLTGCKKIVDAAGRPAFIPQTPLGEWPPTLLGHPVIETPRCPDNVLFFGDFSYVHWRESVYVKLITAREPRAEYNQTLFGAIITFDSGVSLGSSSDPPVTRTAVG